MKYLPALAVHIGDSHGVRRFDRAIVFATLLAGRLLVQGAETKPVTFLKAPPGAQEVRITLSVPEHANFRPGYLTQRSPQALEEITAPPAIAQQYAGKEFWAYKIAELPNGTRYVVAINEDKALKYLNRNEMQVWYARIYKVSPGTDAKPELLREGLQGSGGDVTVPVELELPGIGSTKVKTLRTEVGYNLSGAFQTSRPQVYSGRGPAISVSGAAVMPEGKLAITVDVPEEMTVTPDTRVNLHFEPITPGLPDRHASGTISDFLTLGAARFVVTDIAWDFSAATLAIAGGSLAETLKQQLQLGAELPHFSQVDLVNRRTVTRDEVLERAKAFSGVIFIFGDLPSMTSRSGPGYMGGPPGPLTLPLMPPDVAEQVEADGAQKPLLVFVTRQISLDFLYQDLRNKTPNYFVLSDYADPLRTNFRLPQNPGYWGGYSAGREASLRQLFNLPDKIGIAAFGRSGNVCYVKADVEAEFLPSLAEARASLKDADRGTRERKAGKR